MSAFEEIADRRIEAARKAGLFDDLDGHGRPIADIDRMRPPGWWAARLAERERSKLRREELARDVAVAMPALWREPDEAAVRRRVDALNVRIDDDNAGTSWERHDRLDVVDLIDRWRRLADFRDKRRRHDGHPD